VQAALGGAGRACCSLRERAHPPPCDARCGGTRARASVHARRALRDWGPLCRRGVPGSAHVRAPGPPPRRKGGSAATPARRAVGLWRGEVIGTDRRAVARIWRCLVQRVREIEAGTPSEAGVPACGC